MFSQDAKRSNTAAPTWDGTQFALANFLAKTELRRSDRIRLADARDPGANAPGPTDAPKPEPRRSDRTRGVAPSNKPTSFSTWLGLCMSKLKREPDGVCNAARAMAVSSQVLDETKEQASLMLPTNDTPSYDEALRTDYQDPMHGGRMKHVTRRHFYVRECNEQGIIKPLSVSTDENIADIFTKPLRTKRFEELRRKVLNLDGPEPNGDDDLDKSPSAEIPP